MEGEESPVFIGLSRRMNRLLKTIAVAFQTPFAVPNQDVDLHRDGLDNRNRSLETILVGKIHHKKGCARQSTRTSLFRRS